MTVELETDVVARHNITDHLDTEISQPITSDEMNKSIRGLKKGKAVAEDSIANEFLINARLNSDPSECTTPSIQPVSQCWCLPVEHCTNNAIA